MGNESSKSSNSNRMALSAVAQMMRITKPELLALRDKCLAVSDFGNDVHTASGYRLTRLNFVNTMREMNVTYEPDYQILEKLFIMWDSEGVDWVDTVSGVQCGCPNIDGMQLSFSSLSCHVCFIYQA